MSQVFLCVTNTKGLNNEPLTHPPFYILKFSRDTTNDKRARGFQR